MLKTTNYQMNKPELTDSPPDITVLNGNFDILDEKLFAVIKAWEDFKASGGEIGGPITLPYGKIFNSGSAFLIEGKDDSSVMFRTTRSSDNRKGDLVINNTETEYNVRPSSANAAGQMDLGASAFPFKDIFLSVASKSINGYTKLPNGLILQWGKISADPNISSMQYPNFPIAFPNSVLTVVGNTSCYDSNTNTRLMASQVLMNNKYNFKYRIMKIGLPQESTISIVEIWWIAIGY